MKRVRLGNCYLLTQIGTLLVYSVRIVSGDDLCYPYFITRRRSGLVVTVVVVGVVVVVVIIFALFLLPPFFVPIFFTATAAARTVFTHRSLRRVHACTGTGRCN